MVVGSGNAVPVQRPLAVAARRIVGSERSALDRTRTNGRRAGRYAPARSRRASPSPASIPSRVSGRHRASNPRSRLRSRRCDRRRTGHDWTATTARRVGGLRCTGERVGWYRMAILGLVYRTRILETLPSAQTAQIIVERVVLHHQKDYVPDLRFQVSSRRPVRLRSGPLVERYIPTPQPSGPLTGVPAQTPASPTS